MNLIHEVKNGVHYVGMSKDDYNDLINQIQKLTDLAELSSKACILLVLVSWELMQFEPEFFQTPPAVDYQGIGSKFMEALRDCGFDPIHLAGNVSVKALDQFAAGNQVTCNVVILPENCLVYSDGKCLINDMPCNAKSKG